MNFQLRGLIVLMGVSLLGIGHAAIMAIQPAHTSVTVSPIGYTSVTWTVTNLVPGPQVDVVLMSPVRTTGQSSQIAYTANNCNYLPVGGTCNFTTTIHGHGQPATFLVEPEVCAFGEQDCALPATPLTVTIAPTPIAYVANPDNNSISICQIIANGQWDNCTAFYGNDSVGLSTFNDPLALAMNPAGTLAYVPNFESNTISICAANVDGSLGICRAFSDLSFNSPSAVAVNSTNTFLYVLNGSGNSVSVCPIRGDGSFSACQAGTNSIFVSPQSMTLQAVNGSMFLYIPDGSNSIDVCHLNTNGTLGTCIAKSDIALSWPRGISFSTDGNTAYVSNYDNSSASTVSICPVNNNGQLGACAPGLSGNGTFNFTEDWAVGLFMSEISTDGLRYGYVPNNGSNSVSICLINNDNSIGNCTAINDPSFDQPSSITLFSR